MEMDHRMVTLVDRAMTGGCEFVCDGQVIDFKPKQVERGVAQVVAEWMWRTNKLMVHTTDGRFVHRVAIKQPPDELVTRLGEEIGDDSPIEIDVTRLEGTDIEAFAPDRGAVVVRQLRVPREDFANQGGPTTGSFGKG